MEKKGVLTRPYIDKIRTFLIMKKAFFLLHSAILLAACSSIFGKLISLDAVLITWYRMLLAGIILIILLITKERKFTINKTDRHVLLVGALLALHWIFFYASIKYANVSIGVICFCLSGFFTAIISPLINHQRISLTEILLSSLSLVGISLIFHFDSSFRLGIGLGIISSILFALYATFNEQISSLGNELKTTTLQMIGGCISIVCLFPLYWQIMPPTQFLPAFSDFGLLFLLALGCTVCMCLLLNKAQKVISAFTVSLSFNLEPIYSIVLAIIIFHENKMLGASFYTGLSMIVLSLLLQMIHVIYSKNKG